MCATSGDQQWFYGHKLNNNYIKQVIRKSLTKNCKVELMVIVCVTVYDANLIVPLIIPRR